MQTKIPWYPLFLDESPGDPELGGWRPVHPTLFYGKVKRQIEAISLLVGIQQLSQEIARRNLESAIQFVATMVSIKNQVTA